MAKAPKMLEIMFHDTLKDMYFAEKKILNTLPKMAKAAHSEQLKAPSKTSRRDGRSVDRLEQVFVLIDKRPQRRTCAAIVGITDRGAGALRHSRDPVRRYRPRLRSRLHADEEGAQIIQEFIRARLLSTPAFWQRRRWWSTMKSPSTFRT